MWCLCIKVGLVSSLLVNNNGFGTVDTNAQTNKKKAKEQEKRKAYEAEKAKKEVISKKRNREERRERYRTEDKQKKKMRRGQD